MKKRIPLLFALALCFALLPTVAMAAEEEISYYTWNDEEKKLIPVTMSGLDAANVKEITSGMTTWETGWYIARGTVTISERVTVSGDVHLILANKCNLTVTQGITVEDDDNNSSNGSLNSLTIYAQSTDTKTRGKLIAGGENTTPQSAAGIGGTINKDGGTITINGGSITAKGHDKERSSCGTGIGGGKYGSGGTITINGGYVYARGGTNAGSDEFCAPAIGGGAYPAGDTTGTGGAGTITINGGYIKTSRNRNINSIGGGYWKGDQGSVTINGGIICDVVDSKIIGDETQWKNCIVDDTVYGIFELNDTYPDYNSAVSLTIETNAHLTLKKNFEVDSNGTPILTNYGTLDIDKGITLKPGNVKNYGTLTNKGQLEFDSWTSLTNSGTFKNEGSMSLKSGNITNSSGAKLNNSGTISVSGADYKDYKLTNDGELINSGTITTSDNYTIENNDTITNAAGDGCSFTIGTGCTLTNDANGKIENNAELTNNGTVTNKQGGQLTNNKTFTNNKTVDNQGTLTNSSGATLTVGTDGSLKNSAGTLTNSGILTLADSERLSSDSGRITGDGRYLISAPLDINIVGPDDLVYNGQPVTGDKFSLPTAIAIGGNSFTLPADEWEFSAFSSDGNGYVEVTDAGDYYVLFKNKTDSSKTIRKTFSIKPLDISDAGVTFTYTLGNAPVYNGEEKEAPVSSIMANGLTVTYKVVNNSDKATNAGHYILTIEGTGNFKGKQEISWNIEKGENPMTVPKTVDVTYGDTDKTIPVTNAAGAVTYEYVGSGDSYGAVSVAADGKLTINKAGKAYFKVTAAGDSNYNPITKNVVIDVDKAKNPMTVAEVIEGTYGETDKVISVTGAVGDVSYEVTSGADVVSVDTDGKLTFHKGGMAKVKVTAAGNENYKEGTKLVDVNVNKAAVTVTALDKEAYVNDTAPDLSNPVQGKDYTLSGLVGTDTLETTAVVKLAYGATLDMDKEGEYPIVPTVTGTDSRYDFSYVSGKLTLTYRPAAPTYAVTLPEQPKNGTVTFKPQNASKGLSVTLTVTPDDGYTLESLTVIDKNGNKLTLRDKGNGKYAFTMPACGVTVAATFVKGDGAANVTGGFTDVPETAYFYDAVNWAAENNITGGTTETTFSPYVSCTRAQVVTFLYRCAVAKGLDVSQGGMAVREFTDYESIPDYAVAAMQWAVNAGILQGNDGALNPNAPCTRAQIVTFLFRFAAAYGMDAVTLQELVSSYGDAAQVPGYAIPAFNWALAGGVIQGNSGSLLPNQTCTRAQIVTMLYRMLGEV